MPNWCSNNLTVVHSDPAKLQEFCDAYNAGHVLSHYIPQPESVPAGEVVVMHDGTPVKTMSDGEHSWRVSNWGTKWDIAAPDTPVVAGDGEVTVSFESAWSPPEGLFARLEELGYGVRATYFEPGMGFCGLHEDGNDEFYGSLPHGVPQSLWDEFDMGSFYEEDE